jgi:hypothetical protein
VIADRRIEVYYYHQHNFVLLSPTNTSPIEKVRNHPLQTTMKNLADEFNHDSHAFFFLNSKQHIDSWILVRG